MTVVTFLFNVNTQLFRRACAISPPQSVFGKNKTHSNLPTWKDVFCYYELHTHITSMAIILSTNSFTQMFKYFGNPETKVYISNICRIKRLKNISKKKPVHCSYEYYWYICVNIYHVHYSIKKIKDTLRK